MAKGGQTIRCVTSHFLCEKLNLQSALIVEQQQKPWLMFWVHAFDGTAFYRENMEGL